MTPPQDATAGMNRRQFLILTAMAMIAGRQAVCAGSNPTGTNGTRVVNAGPVSNYATDGVYDSFLDQGFFIIRKGKELFALSSDCTHRQCKLKVGSHRSFYCPCHGSTFDSSGKVTDGPAKRDLPVLPSSTNETGQLLVTVPAL